MFPAVIKSVIGRFPTSRPATIEGYRRLEVTGESFPGLIEEDGARSKDFFILILAKDEWERLTAFEDDFYELEEVTVFCAQRRCCTGLYRAALAQVCSLGESLEPGVLSQESSSFNSPFACRRDRRHGEPQDRFQRKSSSRRAAFLKAYRDVARGSRNRRMLLFSVGSDVVTNVFGKIAVGKLGIRLPRGDFLSCSKTLCFNGAKRIEHR